MEQPEQGIVQSTSCAGSVTQVVIETDSEVVVLDADTNMLIRALTTLGRPSLVGARIEFERTDWPGGLAAFSLAEDTDEGVYCGNCRKLIPPSLLASFCVFGKHPRRALKPSNGAHADE